jgi:hypothetical protein
VLSFDAAVQNVRNPISPQNRRNSRLKGSGGEEEEGEGALAQRGRRRKRTHSTVQYTQ